MSKKNKAVEVEINEGKNNKGDRVDLEVNVKNRTIGTIEQLPDDKQVTIKLASGKERKAQSVDEAIQALIAEYNLHDL